MEKRQLCEAIGEWLECYKKKSVKALTYDRLLISFKLMTKYPISDWPVNEIDSRLMQKYLNQLATDGYSMSTIKKQFNLLTAYWKHAMALGEIERPIFLGVSLPSEAALVTKSREIETYSHEEQNRMLDILQTFNHPQYAVVILMLETGMRIGEVLGLSWIDILWNRRAVSVKSTLIRLSSEPGMTFVQNTPKSKTSRRTIPLSDTAYDTLKRLYDRSKTKRGLIFAKEDDPSLPYSYSSVEFHTRKVCKILDIPYRGLHAFRHTFATNCYDRGCDVKILSKLLGHADVAITYNIYIHLYGDALEEMRKALG